MKEPVQCAERQRRERTLQSLSFRISQVCMETWVDCLALGSNSMHITPSTEIQTLCELRPVNKDADHMSIFFSFID